MPRDLSAALALIRAFEGFRPHPYLDAVGIVTIGYGHVVHGPDGQPLRGPEGMAQARQQYPTGMAERDVVALLLEDFARFAAGVEALVTVALTDAQLGALASFAFNVGLGAFKISTLRRRLNAGQYDAVPGELMKWTRAGGRVLLGLVRRRRAESDLWSIGA